MLLLLLLLLFLRCCTLDYDTPLVLRFIEVSFNGVPVPLVLLLLFSDGLLLDLILLLPCLFLTADCSLFLGDVTSASWLATPPPSGLLEYARASLSNGLAFFVTAYVFGGAAGGI